MTAQIAERLDYQSESRALCAEPLADYFHLAHVKPPFVSPSTALWRGYVGSWEIVDGRLYLIGLRGRLKDGSEGSLATIFPAYPQRVFAHWYSGRLRLPQGRLLEYVHGGYDSRYERDLFLTLERGVLVGEETVVNGVAADDAPEGYGIGAMTTFARPSGSSRQPPVDKGVAPSADGSAAPSAARGDETTGGSR